MPKKIIEEKPRRRWARNRVTCATLGISAMSLWRWRRDPKLKFPLPTVINDIEYTDLDELEEWMRSRVVDRAAERARSQRGKRAAC